jgi:hypothetical protein
LDRESFARFQQRRARLETSKVVLDAGEDFVQRNLAAIVKWGGL